MTYRLVEALLAGVFLTYVSYVQFKIGFVALGRFGNNPLLGLATHALLILAIVYREKLVEWNVVNFSYFEEKVTAYCVIVLTWSVILWRFGLATGVFPSLFRAMFSPNFEDYTGKIDEKEKINSG